MIGNNYYGPNTGPGLIDSISCTGFEHRLVECPRAPYPGGCNQHVGVHCRSGEEAAKLHTISLDMMYRCHYLL